MGERPGPPAVSWPEGPAGAAAARVVHGLDHGGPVGSDQHAGGLVRCKPGPGTGQAAGRGVHGRGRGHGEVANLRPERERLQEAAHLSHGRPHLGGVAGQEGDLPCEGLAHVERRRLHDRQRPVGVGQREGALRAGHSSRDYGVRRPRPLQDHLGAVAAAAEELRVAVADVVLGLLRPRVKAAPGNADRLQEGPRERLVIHLLRVDTFHHDQLHAGEDDVGVHRERPPAPGRNGLQSRHRNVLRRGVRSRQHLGRGVAVAKRGHGPGPTAHARNITGTR